MLPSNIKDTITSIYSLNTGDVELEARFGLFRKGNFNPGVTRSVFNRVKEYFDKKSKNITQSKITDYISGQIRKSIINIESEDE